MEIGLSNKISVGSIFIQNCLIKYIAEIWQYFVYILYNILFVIWQDFVIVWQNTPCTVQWCSRETVTLETATWLKFRDETETETLSKTPRPRRKTWSSRPRLETSKFVHIAEIFQKKCRHHFWPWASAEGKRAFPPLRLKLNTKIL